MKPRLIAFYLPQFHPIPENDLWWGVGFTEWRTTMAGQPLFRGHYQPHLPSELGCYDLRQPQVRMTQTTLAASYGIDAFCYYHYWFEGKRLLERPFQEVLDSGKPDFPFCLCWANEPWTRRYDGRSREVLMPQTYSERDDLEHVRWLSRAFFDPRYLRVDGKPLFLVYRARSLPSPARTIETWREEAEKLGVGELLICAVESNFREERAGDPTQYGFDAAVEFQPDIYAPTAWSSLRMALTYHGALNVTRCMLRFSQLRSYAHLAATALEKIPRSTNGFPASPLAGTTRRAAGAVVRSSTPIPLRACTNSGYGRCANVRYGMAALDSYSLTPGTNGVKGVIWNPISATVVLIWKRPSGRKRTRAVSQYSRVPSGRQGE